MLFNISIGIDTPTCCILLLWTDSKGSSRPYTLKKHHNIITIITTTTTTIHHNYHPKLTDLMTITLVGCWVGKPVPTEKQFHSIFETDRPRESGSRQWQALNVGGVSDYLKHWVSVLPLHWQMRTDQWLSCSPRHPGEDAGGWLTPARWMRSHTYESTTTQISAGEGDCENLYRGPRFS